MRRLLAVVLVTCVVASLDGHESPRLRWEAGNPIRPLAPPPAGMEFFFREARTTPDPARVRLGRWLFFDTRLSVDGTIACASCHRPSHAFSEPTAVSTGVRGQRGARKAPSLLNLAVTERLMGQLESEVIPRLFWDGRASSLEEQAVGPLTNAIEMGGSRAAIKATVEAIPGYRRYFKEAFGTERITLERIAKALADYERTLVSGNSPYDRWSTQREVNAISAEAKRGHNLFFDKAGCAVCHAGLNFTDNRFHNLGVGWSGTRFSDDGRFLVTGREGERGAFRTPGLRDVSRRAPYMHDGSMKTLREVVEFYNRGGNANPRRSSRLRPLGLSATEIDALVEFLRTLDGHGYDERGPATFPR